jgi:hypothetical protein
VKVTVTITAPGCVVVEPDYAVEVEVRDYTCPLDSCTDVDRRGYALRVSKWTTEIPAKKRMDKRTT